MACNAWNHGAGCSCGFGGDTGGGGWTLQGRSWAEAYTAGWTRDWLGTVESYTIPNARCPVCGATVFFYRSPYDGRVYFDPPLGPPWPKHPCTDNGRQSSRVLPDWKQEEPNASAWAQGWRPLYYAKVYGRGEHTSVKGEFRDGDIEIAPIDGGSVDKGPVYIRPLAETLGIYGITFLRSDRKHGTSDVTTFAVDSRLRPLARHIIEKALTGDGEALAEIGRFILYELEDPEWALPYLERALKGGLKDVLFDLAVIAAFNPDEG